MKIFCSGIGGIGLSAYAALQKHAGNTVHGSDRTDSALLQDLRSQGITIHLTQDGSAIEKDVDLLVYSEAIPADGPERTKARDLGIRSISYFQALGELSREYDVIAVCGTHGKSSTTAMTARLLIEAGLDPTVVVGTKVPELDGRNWRKGKTKLFLVEACEYRRSFHSLAPDIVLLTTADGDHFDAYADIAEYRQAFADFLKLLPVDGTVITHGGDPHTRALAENSGRTFIDADSYPLVAMKTPGLHMRQNAQLSLALATKLGIDAAKAAEILSGFSGTWRRMETKGVWGDDVIVVDDYGHHPAEIRATLSAMREAHPDRRIVCAFQPHTHDRTLKLYDEFMASFADADVVIVPNIYAARRNVDAASTVDVDAFVRDLAKASGKTVINGKSMEETQTLLETEILKPHDLLVCMGAGDITGLAERMAKR